MALWQDIRTVCKDCFRIKIASMSTKFKLPTPSRFRPNVGTGARHRAGLIPAPSPYSGWLGCTQQQHSELQHLHPWRLTWNLKMAPLKKEIPSGNHHFEVDLLFLSINQVSLWSFQPPLFCLSSILPGQGTVSGGEVQNGSKWTMLLRICYQFCIPSPKRSYPHFTQQSWTWTNSQTRHWTNCLKLFGQELWLPFASIHSHSHPPSSTFAFFRNFSNDIVIVILGVNNALGIVVITWAPRWRVDMRDMSHVCEAI